ncbi:MAG TPA: DNA translocase FtsK, partial [Candidatus Bathyarchaeia archaeon]|nr:DNA translocase FtsK [Candidatus Bathyarchaeia archaeon]
QKKILPSEKVPAASISGTIMLPKTEEKISYTSGYDQEQEVSVRAKTLEEKLARFGIKGTVVDIKKGPVITLFEYQPHADTKLSKIVALEDDLAMALQAVSIRIIAPIPGKSVVGFEITNTYRTSVLFSQLMHEHVYQKGTQKLPLIFGVNTTGDAVIVDLVKLPHLLIAGSTGSGKSVALNAMITSLLCKRTYEELRLILIDPKRLEFAGYEDIPHLLFPLVTDPRKAVPVMRWVVKHMEERYTSMAAAGVRNIEEYNQQKAEKLPYIVIIIDELADLMMSVGRDIEDLITRVAQMARAAGIHMIVATQRPSVDVITGLIKVNFPSRISFRVTSRIDSRTILDGAGAEKLIGNGDMLFLGAHAPYPERLHGAYITPREINFVVDQIKKHHGPLYMEGAHELIQQHQEYQEQDPLYHDIVLFLQQVDDVSISLLQRKFHIGYNRSARIIESLEMQGRIMPSDGGKTRKVIR